ncbi:MAG: cytochrome c-type biogenesis protein CcmH [Gammaproteobacteria bacterium]|nr:cytochrome c-type biogenesis protein CcmH [Gammaproteobacteria bacterium]
MRFLIGALLIACAGVAGAGLEAYEFTDAAEEQRFKELIAELRCLVCQNQSLLDSDASLAEDLRRETYNLMKTGRDDAQIVQYLVDRYGNFVRYRPPLDPSTYLLWFGPLVLFLLGGFWVFRTVRHQRAAPQISEADAERAARLLDEESK